MVATEGGSVVVCDAGPLIHLDEIGSLDLLSDFAHVLVPDAVWREVDVHRPAALASAVVKPERVAAPAARPAELEALSRVLSLHAGETEALAVAADRPGAILLTDDTAARLAADTLSIEAHGTLGVLTRAIRRGLRSRDQVLDLLRALPTTSTLHLKPDLLNKVIRAVEGA
jgi:predicted nucleic acid-binding protein